jgi:hypothetical protein
MACVAGGAQATAEDIITSQRALQCSCKGLGFRGYGLGIKDSGLGFAVGRVNIDRSGV